VDALGVIAIGVGGLEAETVMLGRPSWMRLPDIVGVKLTGQRQPGITATDIVLALTEFLRKERGRRLSGILWRWRCQPDHRRPRHHLQHGPEYGATAAMFYIDQQTIDYLQADRPRSRASGAGGKLCQGSGLWADSLATAIRARAEFDLSSVVRNMAGPSNPHKRLPTSSAALPLTWPRPVPKKPKA
jgi:aconitate hydratase